MSQTEKELSYKAFLNREYGFRHSPFEKEFEFYECVKKGDVDGVERDTSRWKRSGNFVKRPSEKSQISFYCHNSSDNPFLR